MEIQELYSLFIKARQLVSTDTRSIIPGSLFFALKGPNFNGNHFVQSAIDAGALACIIDEDSSLSSEKIIQVSNVLESLQRLAHYHRLKCKTTIIAITGSNGKTTTKELTAAIFSTEYNTNATTGNLNNHIGVPLTLLKLKNDTEFLILELGANHKNEIKQLCAISEPDAGLITNIGIAHLEGFGSLEGVKEAKKELFDYLEERGKPCFYNLNDVVLSSMFEHKNWQHSFGDITTSAEYKASIKCLTPGIDGEFNLSNGVIHLQSRLSGRHNFQNIIAACSLAAYFNIRHSNIQLGISTYVPSNMRTEKITYKGNLIYLDAYNANPSSMHAAISDFMSTDGGNKWIIIGVMAELGDFSASEHLKLYTWVRDLHPQLLICVGNAYKHLAKDAAVCWFPTVDECKQWLTLHWPENTTIFIKGSRSASLEKLINSVN